MNLWIGYVAFMAFLELALGLFLGGPPSRPVKVYVALALVMEFPSALFGMGISTMAPSLLWASLWYSSLVLMAVLLIRGY
ncbi:hypothetical protein [Thermococcus sp.]|uniref:hypothetical protein n=1 Tax=Thermococcus sp. TaxID=35749 RepID=UPI002630B048|nr:hypothetical protein [Thermococcus sp.]